MIGPPPYRVSLTYRPKALPEGIRANVEVPNNSAVEHGVVTEVAGWVACFAESAANPPISVVVSAGESGWLETSIHLTRPDVVSNQHGLGGEPVSAQCGFSLLLPVHMTQNAGPYFLSVRLKDGTLHGFAQIGFESPLDKRWRLNTDIQPVIVNSIGRAGSSLLCRMLSAHPSLHVPQSNNQFGEISICGYVCRLLAVLASSGSYGGLNRIEEQPDFHFMEPPHFASRMLRSAGMDEFHHGHVVESLSEGARDLASRILLDYVAFVSARNSSARFIVEKSWNSYNINLLRLLFVDFKEVFVVREPSEFIRSQSAFLQKQGASASHVDNQLLAAPDRLGNLARSWIDRQATAHLVRYEDLVANPMETLKALCQYIGIPPTDDFVRHASGMIGDDSAHSQMLRTNREALNRSDFRTYIKSLPAAQRSAAEDYLRVFAY